MHKRKSSLHKVCAVVLIKLTVTEMAKLLIIMIKLTVTISVTKK